MAARKSKRRPGVKPSADAIVEAAERVFARQGYGATSLRTVMSAARVSTTAFYARFPSKEAVLEALVRRVVENLATEASSVLGSASDVREGFDVAAGAVLRSLVGHRALVRIALSEGPVSPGARRALSDAYGMLVTLVAARLDALAGQGLIPRTDSRELAWGLVGALQIHVVRWAVFEDIDDAELGRALRETARALLPALRLNAAETRG
jgi:AcrR family transcriptional regulator